MYDALGYLEKEGEVTAAGTVSSDAYDLKKGTPLFGLVARVVYSGAKNATGSNTITFSIEHSDDPDTGWFALASGAADTVTLDTTEASGEVFIPFRTDLRYVRLVTVTAGAGTVPVADYEAQIGLSKP